MPESATREPDCALTGKDVTDSHIATTRADRIPIARVIFVIVAASLACARVYRSGRAEARLPPMTPRTGAGIVLTAALTLLTVTVLAQDAARAPLANARLDHIVIAARDADRTAAQFATLLGVLPPKSRVVSFNVPRP